MSVNIRTYIYLHVCLLRLWHCLENILNVLCNRCDYRVFILHGVFFCTLAVTLSNNSIVFRIHRINRYTFHVAHYINVCSNNNGFPLRSDITCPVRYLLLSCNDIPSLDGARNLRVLSSRTNRIRNTYIRSHIPDRVVYQKLHDAVISARHTQTHASLILISLARPHARHTATTNSPPTCISFQSTIWYKQRDTVMCCSFGRIVVVRWSVCEVGGGLVWILIEYGNNSMYIRMKNDNQKMFYVRRSSLACCHSDRKIDTRLNGRGRTWNVQSTYSPSTVNISCDCGRMPCTIF